MTKIIVPVTKLTVGLHVSMPSGYIDHPFFLNSFELKDKQQILIIRKMGLVEIEVDVDKSLPAAISRLHAPEFDPSAPRYIKPAADLVPLSIDQLCRKALIKADQLYKKQLSIIQEVFSLAILDPEKSAGMADIMIGQLQMLLKDKQGAKLCYVATDCTGERIYQNALNTLILTLMMCKDLNLGLKQQNDLAQIAIFHNFGELYVPEQIRQNNGELTKPEMNFLKQHPLYTQNKLKETNAFSLSITSTIAAHHERLDGSGYPNGLHDKQLTMPVQLFTVVDAFEELINNREHAKQVSGNIAVMFLVKNAGIKFNAKLVDSLLKTTGVYPPGTLLKVDGQFAVVSFSNQGLIKQPIIKLYTPEDDNTKIKFIDISQMEQADIVCIKKQDLPENAAKYLNMPSTTNFSLVALSES